MGARGGRCRDQPIRLLVLPIDRGGHLRAVGDRASPLLTSGGSADLPPALQPDGMRIGVDGLGCLDGGCRETAGAVGNKGRGEKRTLGGQRVGFLDSHEEPSTCSFTCSEAGLPASVRLLIGSAG